MLSTGLSLVGKAGAIHINWQTMSTKEQKTKHEAPGLGREADMQAHARGCPWLHSTGTITWKHRENSCLHHCGPLWSWAWCIISVLNEHHAWMWPHPCSNVSDRSRARPTEPSKFTADTSSSITMMGMGLCKGSRHPGLHDKQGHLHIYILSMQLAHQPLGLILVLPLYHYYQSCANTASIRNGTVNNGA